MVASLTQLKHLSLNDCRLSDCNEIVKNVRDGFRVDLFHNLINIRTFIALANVDALLAIARGNAPVRWTMWVNNAHWSPSAAEMAYYVANESGCQPQAYTFAPAQEDGENIYGTHTFAIGALRLHMAIDTPAPKTPSHLPADWPLRPPDA